MRPHHFHFQRAKRGDRPVVRDSTSRNEGKIYLHPLVNIMFIIDTNASKEFQSEYLITGRVLGSGAYGQVHMAVNQRDGTQLACKIVDLTFIKSHLRSLGSSKPGQSQTPAPAADIDPHAQILEVRKWAERRQMTRNINSKLRVYDREVEILQKLWHVSSRLLFLPRTR